jgi:hypothetical protein
LPDGSSVFAPSLPIFNNKIAGLDLFLLNNLNRANGIKFVNDTKTVENTSWRLKLGGALLVIAVIVGSGIIGFSIYDKKQRQKKEKKSHN